MSSSFKERFFPNECHICRSREKLERCVCKMIAYCSKEHQFQHLPVHGSFCKVVQQVLKEKGISHINERIISTNTSWNIAFEHMINFEKKLGRCMTPLEISMWIRPRVCFSCKDSRNSLYDCPKCPIASFCYNHKRGSYYNSESHDNCIVMNRYLKTLSVAEELNIDMQFLPSCFPYISEDRFDIFDPLTYTFKDSSSELQCKESLSTKETLMDFINIASRLNAALEKIFSDTIPEKIVIHINAFNNHAIINANYWEFLLHVYPQIRNLKIAITGNATLPNNLMNYSLCEKCVKLKKTLSVEKYLLTYEDYMLKSYYQVPDVLFNFRIAIDCNFKRFNKWNQIRCPVILLPNSKFSYFKDSFFLSFLLQNFQIIFNGEIKTAFNEEKKEYDADSYFIIFQSKRSKKQEISPANNSKKNDTSLISTKDDLMFRPSSPFSSSFTIFSKPKEGDNNVEKNASNDNSIADDDLESFSTENESLIIENSSLKAENEKLQHELSSSTEKVAKLQQELNSSTDEVAKLQQELNSTTDKLEKRNAELEKISFQFNQMIQSIRNISKIEDKDDVASD
ncbi:uncharacterized protein LOC122508645 [Leptopilina heterotoma]|uniref:uncharacterized protein LOC122508645 n=1 Tax=Leptopilina heterotoma TaxID=63436 RepID=UPI001CA8F605|nr:uncharacterized protein LOC122508645 [Leptopilina heterotoma]